MAPTPSPMTMKRIHREISDTKKEDLGAMTLVPSEESLFRWSASIPGPQGSPYEGGVFRMEIVLGNDYPFSAPKVTFLTRIYHMNISDRGSICIDILKSNWSPALSLFKVMLSLSSLLTDPNPSDPLVPSIATEYVRNRKQHDRTAKEWTEMYAKPGAQGQGSSSSTPNGTSTQSARTRGSRTVAAAGSLPPLTVDNIAARTQRMSAAIMASRARDLLAAHAVGSRAGSNTSTSTTTSRTRPASAADSRTSTPAAGPSSAGVGSAILIDDSDDENGSAAASRRADAKRKRKPGQGRSGEVEVVEDRNVRRRVEAGGGGGGAGMGLSEGSEVIVIDD